MESGGSNQKGERYCWHGGGDVLGGGGSFWKLLSSYLLVRLQLLPSALTRMMRDVEVATGAAFICFTTVAILGCKDNVTDWDAHF